MNQKGELPAGKKLDQRLSDLAREIEKLTKEARKQNFSDNEYPLSISDRPRPIEELEDRIDRLLRLKEVLEYIPVSRSTWYAGIKSGRYPAPVRHLGPKISAWSLSSIMHLVNGK